MLSKASLIAFLATSDPHVALVFYRDVLGLRLVSDDPYALVFDAHGTTLRIAKVDKAVIAPYTVLGWHVKDIAESVARLQTRGVTFERFGEMDQDESGIAHFPGGARVAWFKDPEGHLLSLTQHD